MRGDHLELNRTHDAALKSWVQSANFKGGDFPLQNLPFGTFRRLGSGESFRGGIAIGDQIVDLQLLAQSGLLSGISQASATACSGQSLNPFLAMGADAWTHMRHAVFGLLCSDADSKDIKAVRQMLVHQGDAELRLPAEVGDYTDFSTSLHHSINAGKLFNPSSPLSANFRHLPPAYHGRSSTLIVSGEDVQRPKGQWVVNGEMIPRIAESHALDYECELGAYVGIGNRRGRAIAVEDAESHVFGISLLNDWSARDIQFWEMPPLGPFLGKSFATTVSPWVVTMEALLPFRTPVNRPMDDPPLLAYLDAGHRAAKGGIDIQVSVSISTFRQRASGLSSSTLSTTSFKHQYWSLAQMLAQHTVNGCNLRTGDLLGTGTVSGPTIEEAGSLLELTSFAKNPIQLAGGEERRFLCDDDVVTLHGWCEAEGHVRIGFGVCSGKIVSMAHQPSARVDA